MPSSAKNRKPVDGRRERTDLTRRNLLSAARELILEGNYDPTAQAIAAHTGITRRTLFRHFPDMETLHSEIILDAQDYAQSVMDEPFPTSTTRWQEQMAIVIERRVRIYEYLLPLYISAVYQSFRTNTSQDARRKVVRRRRARLKEILPSDLLSNALLVESLDAILSIEYWVTLREDQQLSVAKATRVLRYAVAQLTNSATG